MSSVLDKFTETFHICDLADQAGLALDAKESTKNWIKYKDSSGTSVLVNKASNIYQIVNGSASGGKWSGPVEFFIDFFPGVERGNWSNIMAEASKMLNLPDDFKPAKPAEYKRQAATHAFGDKERSKLKYYHNKSTAPLNTHPYLISERFISPTLLKQTRFNNCLRVPTGNKVFFKNALFYHRDEHGICAYEKHNSTKDGNLNLISTNSRKCLWYTDDITNPKTKQVCIGEAAIDVLSFATLTEKSRPDMALLSFGGQFEGRVYLDKEKTELNTTSHVIKTLKKLFDQSKAEQIYLSNDNDDAGRGYDQFFIEFFDTYYPDRFEIFLNKAPHGLNDWNDYLFAEHFNTKSNYINLAKQTNHLILAEGGIGAFRMFPSDKVEGVTVMCLPPSGHLTGQMAAVAKSFMHVMKNENPNSHVTYTSTNDDMKYIKPLELWRREFLPELNYNVKKSYSPLEVMAREDRLPDLTVLKSWDGYRENTKHPLKLAQHTTEIIITKSPGDEVRFFNNNCDPIKMIIAVPDQGVQLKNKYALGDVNKFISNALRYSKHEVVFKLSSCKGESGEHDYSHCAFLNESLQSVKKYLFDKERGDVEAKINAVKPIKLKSNSKFDNVLQQLVSMGKVKSNDLESISPSVSSINPKKKVSRQLQSIPNLDHEQQQAFTPMG